MQKPASVMDDFKEENQTTAAEIFSAIMDTDSSEEKVSFKRKLLEHNGKLDSI